jgi:hypothetical protein
MEGAHGLAVLGEDPCGAGVGTAPCPCADPRPAGRDETFCKALYRDSIPLAASDRVPGRKQIVWRQSAAGSELGAPLVCTVSVWPAPSILTTQASGLPRS